MDIQAENISIKRGSGHTRRQWEVKFFLCGCQCIYCGEPLTLDRATKDHLIPLTRGGSDLISNIAPACFRCNNLKGKRTLDEFLRDRPAFSEHVLTSTPIGKPIQQAAALATVGVSVEKPKRVPSPRRFTDLVQHDKRILREMLADEQNVSWAWRNHP